MRIFFDGSRLVSRSRRVAARPPKRKCAVGDGRTPSSDVIARRSENHSASPRAEPEVSDFTLIRSEAPNFPVRVLCTLLGVSPSGYYAWLKRGGERSRRRDEVRLVAKMRAVHAETNGVYGSRRVTAELVAADEQVGRHRVRRLMRKHGLQAREPDAVAAYIDGFYNPRRRHSSNEYLSPIDRNLQSARAMAA